MISSERLRLGLNHPGYAFGRLVSIVREHAEDAREAIFPPTKAAVVNEREYMVLGLRRSGNHAVIHWIEQQAGSKGLHLNNLRRNENPYRFLYEIARHPNASGHAYAINELLRYEWYINEANLEWLRRDAKGSFIGKEYLIHSYEDFLAYKLSDSMTLRRRQRYFGDSALRRDVLILRDPFNLVASRLHSGRASVKHKHEDVLSIWIEHAREYLGEQNALRNKVVINFNKWTSDPTYRRAISEKLGLVFVDNGVDSVPTIGGGSSFDRLSYDGRASEMDVHGRWRRFEDSDRFIRCFTDPTIFRYAKRIFGEMDGIERLEERASMFRS
jgi:hypothetical protein